VNAGSEYARLISDQLAEERDRKKSLEQRGTAVVTTVSALTSLLLGLGALVTKSASFSLPEQARPFVVWALISFVVAAVLAVATNLPVGYREPDIPGLRRLVTPENWGDNQDTGSISVADVQVTIIESARKANGRKALLLVAALSAEVVAVALLGRAVWLILS